MRYITYDEAGNTTGAFLQDLHSAHAARHIECTEAQAKNWVNLRVVDCALEAIPAPSPEVLLERAQAQAWQQIKAHRERLSDQGGYKATVGGVEKWFHSDDKSKTQQIALVVAGAAVPAVQWKTMDGSFITMSQAWAVAIFNAAATQDATIFAVAEGHRTAMLAAADPLAYDFSAGWPAVFGG